MDVKATMMDGKAVAAQVLRDCEQRFKRIVETTGVVSCLATVLVGVASMPEMHTLPNTLARRFRIPYQLAIADSREWESSWHAIEPLLACWHQAANSANIGDAMGAALGAQ